MSKKLSEVLTEIEETREVDELLDDLNKIQSINEDFEYFLENDEIDELCDDIHRSFIIDEKFEDFLNEDEDDHHKSKIDEIQIQLKDFIKENEQKINDLSEKLDQSPSEIIREIVVEKPVEVAVEKPVSNPAQDYESRFNNMMQRWERRISTAITHAAIQGGGAGGGSTMLMDNDDVIYKKNSQIANNSVLGFDNVKKKYVANTISNVMGQGANSVPLFIANTQPDTDAAKYMWVETDIGIDNSGFTFWVEDGKL